MLTDRLDLDHLVIGPGGVFAVNAKHHPRGSVGVGDHVVFVNGAKTPYAAAARRDADQVARLLTRAAGRAIEVRPVIAVVGASVTNSLRRPRGVTVIPVQRLTRWLRACPPSLSDAHVDELIALARAPGTWRTDP
jgi:hypothetical protein